MKKRLLLFVLLLSSIAWPALAQSEGNVTGKVVTRVGRNAIQGAKITLKTIPERVATTTADGSFEFTGVSYGVYNATIEAADYIFAEINVRVDVPLRDIGVVTLSPETVVIDLDDAMFTEFDMENESGSMSTPGTLSASRDPFDNVSGYKFSSMRFRTRGYDSGLQNVYMNGIRLNDALTGYSPWSIWSGLNEATRNQEAVGGLNTISNFGLGGVNGVTNIDSRASMLRQGLRGSVVTADAQYRLRLMLTYSSGMLDNGWAYAFSASARLGNNDHIDGVYYNAYGYYAAVEKQFNNRHRLSFTVLGVPTERGAQMAATDEVYRMVDNKLYNPNWGWQDGKMRNSRVRKYHEPLAILNYNFDINDRTKLSVAASYRFGENGYSALDWYDARDPKPDYHRNLPSYYYYRGEMGRYNELWEQWTNHKDTWQINWDEMYDVNRNSTEQWYDKNGQAIGTGRAKYIVSERHTDQRDFNINAHITHDFKKYGRLNAGITGRVNRTEYYTSVKDLLGGDYWLNVDNFVQRDFGWDWTKMPNDLSRDDNMIVKKGDKYGYDYYAHVRDYDLWGIYEMNYGMWDGYVGGQVGYNTFWREGLYQKALFPDNSLGDSEKAEFFTYTAKLGVGYRPSGMHHVNFNAIVMEEAPYFQNAFISPRTRNTLMDGLTTTKTYGADLNYTLRSPWITFRVTGYYTLLKDMSKLISFYDDTASQSSESTSTGAFTNLAMTGIDQQHYGLEFGFRMPLSPGLTLSGALNFGDYTYVSEPTFTQTIDSRDVLIYEGEKIKWKGYRVESTPQLAANIGLNYRTENYWYFGVDFNYFDYMYLSMNPLARANVLYGVVPEDTLNEIRQQEKFHPALIMNLNVGKSWYINRKYQVGFSLEIKNVLGSIIDHPLFTDIRTGGFEQMRIRTPKGNNEDYSAFDSKYFYLPGTNYYLNIYFRF